MDRREFLRGMAVSLGIGAYALGGGKLAEAEVPEEINPPDPPQPAQVFNNLSLSATGFEGLYSQRIIHIGYDFAIRGSEHAYPLLARAIKNSERALSPKIEWLHKKNGKIEVLHNYTQIFRNPFGITGTQMHSRFYDGQLVKLRNDALHAHLGAVENCLRYGTCKEEHTEFWSKRTMGGIKQYPAGTPKLMILRDLQLITNRQRLDADMYEEELLGEVTLKVS